MSSKGEKCPMPEHDKRSVGYGLHSDVEAAYAYVESVDNTCDIPASNGWHGWALREAFLAGISHADAGKQAENAQITLDRESRLEAALAALLAEVVNMREDYPAEAWRFSDDVIAEAESAMDIPKQG
ncbi:hypothetical protein ACSZNZ_22930 [Aeromonas caviae]|uniref:hypothetical protein n=1 Tax=Gammaproteobacteria TaxID=1236 RepID=UPI0037D7DFBC